MREDKVEDADDIIDVTAIGAFGGNPATNQPIREIEEAFAGLDAVFCHLRDVGFHGISNGGVEVIDFPEELIAELGDYGMVVGHFGDWLVSLCC